jgi:acetyl esterase/lipase
MNQLPRYLLTFILSLLAALTAVSAEEHNPAAKSREVAPSPPFELRPVRNVVYRGLYPGEDGTRGKNRLDLYLPKGRSSFPVVFFVHGGAWQSGDKEHFGVYSGFAMALAREGIGAVVANYRLSPRVQHPEHIKDVAKAFAWTVKHIAEYGGRTDEIFVCGHSAGGHLAALLATDDSYLKAEGLTLRAIRGVIAMSGVFVIPEVNRLFNAMFGDDPKLRLAASPIAHARPDAPPFLIMYAERDLPFCDRTPCEAFYKALRDQKVEAQILEMKNRNHITVMMNACVPRDPATQAILRFITAHLEK